MPTTLLYHDDDHLMRFEATILAIDPAEQTITLDATAFFPMGGHQHPDHGRIAKDAANYALVTDVRKDEDGTVVHHYLVLRGELSVGDRIVGTIEEARRRHHMALHSAQHIFSAFAKSRFDLGTGRADFSPDGGLAVMERALEPYEVLLLEDDVNRIIREAMPVERRSDGDRQLIRIGDIDESPCCGTHVKNTSEIDFFKLTSVDGKVLRYETGIAAKRRALRMANHALAASSTLGLEATRDLDLEVRRQVALREEAEKQLEDWKAALTDKRIAAARANGRPLLDGTVTLYQVDLGHLSTKPARDLLKKELVGTDELWLAQSDGGSLLVASSTPAVSARSVVEQFLEPWEMRGGGNLRFAQAGPIPPAIADPLALLATWIDESLRESPSTPSEPEKARR
ncbi:MAG TPA: hypothetical protein ENJ09_13030 [Planctomycetes bacterium]|nr:hypothetical protein [Planctomycetota bacterium]